jgi:rubrerythrin
MARAIHTPIPTPPANPANSDTSDAATWSLAEIPFDRVETAAIRADEHWFDLLTSASFVEITSDLYTRNLVAFFAGDDEIVGWLERRWEHEELQHGMALRRYVETAWPEFDWESAYRAFFAEYSRLCAVELLAPSRALEMAARCVVETGTASFYRMISDAAPEPVLRELARKIADDEVRHYKYFLRFFRRWRAREKLGRLAVMRTILARAAEIDAADAAIAFKHVHLARHPDAGFRNADYRAFRRRTGDIARRHLPRAMAAKMLLKPLDLGPALARALPPATAAAARLLLRG